MDLTFTTECRLAWGALALLILGIVLALLGERSIFLFGCDRELAEKVYKTLFVGLDAGIMALAMPLAIISFVSKLRSLFTTVPGASDSTITQLLLSDDVPQITRMAGFSLLVLFAVAGLFAAIDVWQRDG